MNAQMGKKEIEEFCKLGREEEKILHTIFTENEFSTRRYFRMLKLARTIADLEESREIKSNHLIEAYHYCNAGKKYWEAV